jgi:hypothetical protein
MKSVFIIQWAALFSGEGTPATGNVWHTACQTLHLVWASLLKPSRQP